MNYQDAFASLAEIYLEDSWVLDVTPEEGGASFRMEAVLTPRHSRYHPPLPGEQHCCRLARLTVTSIKRSELERSDTPPSTDASGEIDFGNIDVFTSIDWHGESAWLVNGDWGDLRVIEPPVTITFE